MKWLVTGARGMLGADLMSRLAAEGADATGLDRAALDVCDEAAVHEAVAAHRPDVVVNCAAWTDVDGAEQDLRVFDANHGAVIHLAGACRRTGARLVQISSDYVFPGHGPHGEDDETGPINEYGFSKLYGERAALEYARSYVVRTAWLYGAHGRNFVATMARLAAERDTVDVVADQHGQPTWTGDLADRIVRLVASGAPYGVYHGTNAGETTWYGLACEVFTLLGHDPERVRPTTTDRFPRPARRPVNSVLRHDGWARAGLEPMRDWREALHAAWPHLALDPR
ncbi:dTDP-4-dehydrorhamnose reductase [Actinomadura logoneensis]|uniref:dTDP-4-dehydrorhamnose reductase n=1 Tax=Actinomadura logoneensis TaxID=2293572 RepID=A0A372JKY0_9ACTN|nr:dTDP-4-dehydrorhamnose reductase [Actinomadura logoneensis]RFU40655.1 dTDP-4-dehydrorhamnose reductase [Actinomadura logoneensis]